jgi:hypothetical protein
MSLIPTEEQSELNAIISILQSKIKKLETENEELKQVKNIAYEPMLTPVLSEWDCDDCKFYPCNLRDKDNKLPYGTCGDHSERMVS